MLLHTEEIIPRNFPKPEIRTKSDQSSQTDDSSMGCTSIISNHENNVKFQNNTFIYIFF